ncbi:MAG: agmatine deiminase family protein [Candidatus Micrarchaeota archaeon]|nr:agmatine deiminase family protein [Candidatus Micrarchaeota archaeon]MDE1834176.1 agmatine deiminase family protein [Candidatus Micrarchaeota archaeon]MDE1859696.1 agmatine deiminase family protein [Candidatus Micrarchaeota archaeon]
MPKEVPLNIGYKMPAEWLMHEATWLSWPKNPDSFPGEILKEVENAYIEIISALSKNEKVNLLVDNEDYEKRVRDMLKSKGISDNVFLHRISTSDVWFRDYGPIFITLNAQGRREIAFTHWIFNAWGNKYEDLKKDSGIPERLPLGKIPKFKIPMVLEGGSIDVNGLGTCLTTEQCLLNKNRNPDLNREQISQYLKDYLGATNIIWLEEGIAGDDTDGHVDDIARFVNRNTVVCALENDPNDENYEPLNKNFELLKQAKDQDGNKLNVISLPMPSKVTYDGQRLPASYCNFYIANKKVLVPIFNDDNDKKALSILKELFPGREVIGINCRALVYGFGAIHCVTQQQPKI